MWKKIKLSDVRSLAANRSQNKGRRSLMRPDLLAKVHEEKKRIDGAVDVLQTVPLFSELSDEKLERLARSLTRTTITQNSKSGEWNYSPPLTHRGGITQGGVVISQGDGGDTMYVVESGQLQAEVDVARTVENPEGVVKQYANGDFFGELALVTSDARGATVRCVDDCVLLSLDKATVLSLLPGQLTELVSAHRRRTAMNVLQKVLLFSSLSPSQLDQVVGQLRRVEIITREDGRFFEKVLKRKEGEKGECGECDEELKEVPNGVIIVSDRCIPLSAVTCNCAYVQPQSEGDTGSEMYVVESGRLQAEVNAVTSNGGVVKEYGALEFFGELALVADEKGKTMPRAATVRCTDDCVLLELKRE